MKQLAFGELVIENFKSFGPEPQTIRLDVGDYGLHHMRGRNEADRGLYTNGCGKSSVWDALSWCLFGRTVENLRGTDVAPWTDSRTTKIDLHLRVDEQAHHITHTANPNSLRLDGEVVGPPQIEDLLSLPYKTFLQTILFGQDKTLFFDLENKDQMQLFSDALGLDRWELRSNTAAKRNREELEPKLAELIGLITGKQAAIAEMTQQLAKIDKLLAEADRERAETSESKRAAIAKLEKELDTAEQRLGKADLAYDSARTEQKGLEAKAQELAGKLDKVRRVHLGKEAEFNSLENEYEAISAALAADKGVCPTCGAPLRNNAQIKRHYAKLEAQMRAIDTKTTGKQMAMLEKELKTVRQFLTSFADKAFKLEAAVNMARFPVNSIGAELKGLRKSLEEHQERGNPYRQQKTDLIERKRIQRLALDKLVAEKQHAEDLVNRTKFWVKGFREIQLQIAEDMLQELELVSNNLLADVGMERWAVRYAISKELKSGETRYGMNTTILSPYNDKPVRWECWSGGEKVRLKMIGAIALAEVLLSHAGIQSNLQIFDEPMKFLPVEAVQDVCAMLDDSARSLDKHYWLVDHLAAPNMHADEGVTVIRQKDGSSVIEAD